MASSEGQVQSRKERRLQWWKARNKDTTENTYKETENTSKEKSSKQSNNKDHKKEKISAQNKASKKPSIESATDEVPKRKGNKKKGYVLFVGNLPYTVTADEIRQHFNDTGGVTDVRLLTNKETGKSRGCAYVQFTDTKSHQLALSLHESKLNGRKINVEFTSPGRKTKRRLDKLKIKNMKMARLKKFYKPVPE